MPLRLARAPSLVSIGPFASQSVARWLQARHRNPSSTQFCLAFPVGLVVTTLPTSVPAPRVENFAESARTLITGQGMELHPEPDPCPGRCSCSPRQQGSPSISDVSEASSVALVARIELRGSAGPPRWRKEIPLFGWLPAPAIHNRRDRLGLHRSIVQPSSSSARAARRMTTMLNHFQHS